MTNDVLELPDTVRERLCVVASQYSLVSLEMRALDDLARTGLIAELDGPGWKEFRTLLGLAWRRDDYAVVRDLPVVGDGATTVLLGLAMNSRVRPYRGRKVVKHFKMSPWTTDLSQTLQEGDFHTDLSTARRPPSVTLIHCREPDPKSGMGALRVARLSDLMGQLHVVGAHEAVQLLRHDTVTLVDERAKGAWSGIMATDSSIQFHPATLRASAHRGAALPLSLEGSLKQIHEAAIAVSQPIELGRGDALLVSNVRALHHRAACSVRYSQFPRHFEAREIHVIHLLDEPVWPDRNQRTSRS